MRALSISGLSARTVKADARWRPLQRKESLMTTSPGPAHQTAATADGAALTFRGVDHLGLTARNKAALLGWEQRLRELDVEFTPVRDSELGHHLNFRDPDGIALEFYAPNDRFAAALAELRSREFSDEELLDGAEQLGLGAYVVRRIS